MSFVFSNFLWLLPLISLPILLHLYNKRKFKTVKFSSLKFFNVIKKESINKISLINIILLIIRTLIIFCIIMILSRPVYKSNYNNISNVNMSTIVVIGIDNSISNYTFIKDNFKDIADNIFKLYNNNTIVHIYNISNNELIYDDKLSNINLNSFQSQMSIHSNSIEEFLIKLNSQRYENYLN